MRENGTNAQRYLSVFKVRRKRKNTIKGAIKLVEMFRVTRAADINNNSSGLDDDNNKRQFG